MTQLFQENLEQNNGTGEQNILVPLACIPTSGFFVIKSTAGKWKKLGAGGKSLRKPRRQWQRERR